MASQKLLSQACVLFSDHGRVCVRRLLHCSTLFKEPADVSYPASREPSHEEKCRSETSVPHSQEENVTALTEGRNGHRRKVSLSLPTVVLPHKLQTALEKTLTGYSQKVLAADGHALSDFLLSRKVLTKQESDRRKTVQHTPTQLNPWQDERGSKKSKSFHLHFKYGKRESVAYAASRLPAVYGATLRVLTEIARRDVGFRPETLLDFGSGLGATVWAAHQLWTESLYEYQCVDVSSEMNDLARVMLRGGGEIPLQEPHLSTTEEIPGVYFRQYLPLSNKVQYDVVVGAHTLGEVHSLKLRRMFLASLWRKTKQYLVLIEPGNWTGFNVITEARDMILRASDTWTKYEDESREELDGHVFAPCPHDNMCPLSQHTKLHCHFGQRVQLSQSERGGPLKHRGFRLENFSYVVLRKGQRAAVEEGVTARILQPIRKRTRHVICKLCTKQGEARDVVFTKSKHREVYRQCRESKWGDTLTVQYDVVVGAHTLGEVHSLKLRRMFLPSLWRKTKRYLVLIEPGNWTGFNVITEARDMILRASDTWTKYEDESREELHGHVFAPCPHDNMCPLSQSQHAKLHCHFGQRVQLSQSERSGPLKHRGFRLENFSYMVLRKGQRAAEEEGVSARILQPTRKRTRHGICKLCTKQGEARDVVFTKSKHREVYRQCRESKWGDTLTLSEHTHS